MPDEATARARIKRQEAADMLGLSLRQVDRMVTRNQLDSIKFEHGPREIYADSVDAVLRRRATPLGAVA